MANGELDSKPPFLLVEDAEAIQGFMKLVDQFIPPIGEEQSEDVSLRAEASFLFQDILKLLTKSEDVKSNVGLFFHGVRGVYLGKTLSLRNALVQSRRGGIVTLSYEAKGVRPIVVGGNEFLAAKRVSIIADVYDRSNFIGPEGPTRDGPPMIVSGLRLFSLGRNWNSLITGQVYKTNNQPADLKEIQLARSLVAVSVRHLARKK